MVRNRILVPTLAAGWRPSTWGADRWGWRVLLIAHLLSVVVAFGPMFVYPLLLRFGSLRSPVEQAAVAEVVKAVRRRASEPAFLLVGPLGIATAAAHPDQDIFHRAWVQWAIPLWLFAATVVWFVQRPLSRRVARYASDLVAASQDNAHPPDVRLAARRLRTASAWLTRVTWVSWAGLGLMLWLMVFQPG